MGDGAELLIILQGRGLIDAGGNNFTVDGSSDKGPPADRREPYAPGDALLIPYESGRFDLHPESGTTAIRAYVPDIKKLTERLRQSGATTEQLRTLVE